MKVFDHIDFNEFFEDETKFDFRRPRIEQNSMSLEETILEGLLMEMAQGQRPGSGTRAAIRLDDDDIQYLYQFLPSDWPRALWWRYGPGLINYAKSRHQHIPEHEDDDEDSNFHQVDDKGVPLNDEPTESISFDEGILLGSDDDADQMIKEHPALGAPNGKAKLHWMEPKDGEYSDDQSIGKGGKTLRRYDNIKFGWNKLYHKLNLDYKFGMQRVDDRHWQQHGQLPSLSGYKPLKWEASKKSMLQYFKALGMQHHHGDAQRMDSQGRPVVDAEGKPVMDAYHTQLNNHQVMMSGMHPQKYDPSDVYSNDNAPIHEINPMTHGTHNDGMWWDGHPSAENDKHILQNSEGNPAYTNHMYKLMNNVLGGGHQKYSSRDSKVQPFDLNMDKPNESPAYNVYETFGLHKAIKQQEWELERYFPHELHQMAWDAMEKIANEGKSKLGIDTKTAPVDEDQLNDLYEKMKAQQFRWEPISADKVGTGDLDKNRFKLNQDGSLYKDQTGHSYYKVRDEFIARGMNEIGDMNNWMYRFLERYVNRFSPKKTRGLTHAQHDTVTGIYKNNISASKINDVVNSHPELGFMANGLKQKQGQQSAEDLKDRKIESDFVQSDRQVIRTGEKDKEPDHKSMKLRLNKKYNKSLSQKFTDDDLEKYKSSHTDVMAGGVFHKFGGEDGNIWERNTSKKNNHTWEKIPKQRIFVPLLYRGQVLSSEKQLSKGLNVGSFGHSQAAEVSTNHFGVSLHGDAPSDEFAVSKDAALKYYTEKELESKKNDDPKKPGTYLINRNDILWKAAERGEQPDEELFENNKFDKDGKPVFDHNKTSRFTDHHRSHTQSHPPEEDADSIEYWNMEGQCGNKVEKGQGMPHLRSVFEGVCSALTHISGQTNSEELVKMMSNDLPTLWGWGDDLLRANVADPMFFYNPEYNKYMKADLDAIPEDEGGTSKALGAPRKSGILFEGSPQTGFVWRKKRVANYIQSFSQRGFNQNLLFRRARQGRTEGGEVQATDAQLDGSVKDMNEQKDQWDVAEKRQQGENKFMQRTGWERASAKNSWLRAGEIYTQAKQDAKNNFDIKDVNEMHKLGAAAKNRNLAMLTLWAVESGKVPRAREIAYSQSKPMIKEPVSQELALSKDFPEKYYQKYNEAHAIQYNLAWDWAKAHVQEDFNERVERSLKNKDGHWYDGPTKSIPDAKFVKNHEDQDPIIEMLQNLHEYDARASFSIVKSEEDYSHETPENKQFYKMAEDILPSGLFDFTTNQDHDFMPSFEIDLHDKVLPLLQHDEQMATMIAGIMSDVLLNQIDETTLLGNEEPLRENGKIFRRFLNPTHDDFDLPETVRKIGDEFLVTLDRKIKQIKSGDRKESKNNINIVLSSIGKSHEAGRKEAVAGYNAKIEKADSNSKKEKLENEKLDYGKYYKSFSDTINHENFDPKGVTEIAGLVQGLPKSQSFAWQALEDSFIDQMVEYLSHVDNFNNKRSNVINSIKVLSSLFKEQNVLKHFIANVTGEFNAIKARHKNAHGGGGEAA